MDHWTPLETFKPRRVLSFGVARVADWSVKVYGVVNREIDWSRFAPCWRRYLARLPSPAMDARRPGLGVAILHAGLGDYLVGGWWDNVNELPCHVWVMPEGAKRWRRQRERESFCVWDIALIAYERDRYVEHMLGGGGADRSAYLQARLGDPAARPAFLRGPAPIPPPPGTPEASRRRPGRAG